MSILKQFFAPNFNAVIPNIPDPQPKSNTLNPSFITSLIKVMHIFVVGW